MCPNSPVRLKRRARRGARPIGRQHFPVRPAGLHRCAEPTSICAGRLFYLPSCSVVLHFLSAWQEVCVWIWHPNQGFVALPLEHSHRGVRERMLQCLRGADGEHRAADRQAPAARRGLLRRGAAGAAELAGLPAQGVGAAAAAAPLCRGGVRLTERCILGTCSKRLIVVCAMYVSMKMPAYEYECFCRD